MLEHYFRRPPTERQLATLHLFTFMSDFREAMWGVVQQGASDIEFDFADYTREALRAASPRPLRHPSSPRPWRPPVAIERDPPDRARCVIIGGGVGGVSIAYHLAELGY